LMVWYTVVVYVVDVLMVQYTVGSIGSGCVDGVVYCRQYS